jgi:hypothetical protein
MADSSRPRPADADADGAFERPTGSAPRQILDITLQSCSVELFHALGVAVAPLARSRVATPREHFDPVGVVAFTTAKSSGVLMLSMDQAIYRLLTPPIVGAPAMNDTLREILNQLVGRIKNRLLQFQVTLRVGLPSTTRKQLLPRQRSVAGPVESYVFRTLRGEILVTLAGTIHEEPLKYSAHVRIPKEGDLIEF